MATARTTALRGLQTSRLAASASNTVRDTKYTLSQAGSAGYRFNPPATIRIAETVPYGRVSMQHVSRFRVDGSRAEE